MNNKLRLPVSEDTVIEAIAGIAQKATGVQLGDKQRKMVESRLQKRMLRLGIGSMQEYYDYLKANLEIEGKALVSLLTTHHTYFFREFSHFEYLSAKALPALIPEIRKRADKTLRIWSSACSRGQEAYSLAMYLHAHLAKLAPDIKFEIFASDIDAESVKYAENAVYPYREIQEAPAIYLQDHWARGTEEIADFVRARKGLRDVCKFQVVNLFQMKQTLANKKFDIIFCRNVFIYFSQEQIAELAKSFAEHLQPQGFFILGLSEGMHGMQVPFQFLGGSVYSLKGQHLKVVPQAASQVTPQKAAITRVFCVDDSPTIHSLLKQILKPEHGFEIVGTAIHGKDATEKLKTIKADVMTLDIHMEQEDGIAYLERALRPGHIPVVMISSVSRENSGLALRALSLGAVDYVEKPSLQNLGDRAEEIRNKLRSALLTNSLDASSAQRVHQQFAKVAQIKNPEKKLAVIIAGLGDRKRFQLMLDKWDRRDPGIVLCIEGSSSALPEFAKQLENDTGKKVVYQEALTALPGPGECWLVDFASQWHNIKAQAKVNYPCVLVYGRPAEKTTDKILDWKRIHLVMEDTGNSHRLASSAQAHQPSTSFAYLAQQYFADDS